MSSAEAAAEVLRERGPEPPRVGAVLGSGLGSVADAVADAVAAQAKRQGAATAAGDEVGYAPGDTADFRAVES